MIGEINIADIPSAEIRVSDIPAQAAEYDDEKTKFTNVTVRSRYESVRNFTVIDVETTGLSARKDEILEICAIRFRDGLPQEKFSTLTAPRKKIPPKATKINGISEKMVEGFPHFSLIADSLVEFIGNDNIVGHNLEFDLQFILAHGADVTRRKRKYYDNMTLAKHILKGPRQWNKELQRYEETYDYDVLDYKLKTLCEYYHIPLQDAHRATGDSCATGFLFLELADERTSHPRYYSEEQKRRKLGETSTGESLEQTIPEVRQRERLEGTARNALLQNTTGNNPKAIQPSLFDRLIPVDSFREKALPFVASIVSFTVTLSVLFFLFA